jgi:hypothetical protein
LDGPDDGWVVRPVGGNPERPEARRGGPTDARTLVLLTWLLPGLAHLRLGRRWQGGLLSVVYAVSFVLVLAETIPVYLWAGPAVIAQVGAQVSIRRLAGFRWADVLQSESGQSGGSDRPG